MKLSFEQELKLCKTMLTAIGMDEKDAEGLSAVVTHSDFTGVYSHGLSRFANYMKHFNNKVYNAAADMKITKSEDAIVMLDADYGSGIIAMNRLYEELTEKAKKYGIAMGTANHSTNIGCGSYYAWRAAKDNMIGIFVSNTVCVMAPYGGCEKLIGTNPLVVGVPSKEEYPIVLDMATSLVANGKVQAAARENKPIPEGWALDKDGNPCTDPTKSFALLPAAGYKGYGLAVIIDVLSAMLAGAKYGRNIGIPYTGGIEATGQACILIDVDKFRDIETFKAEVDDYIRMIKNSKKAVGFDEIFMPGEIEFKKYEYNLAHGIEVPENLSKELAERAAFNGVVPEGTTFEELIDIVC